MTTTKYTKGKNRSLLVTREKREKLKAAGGVPRKGKTIQIMSFESIYDKKGNEIGSILRETDYTKAAGPKGFGKKSKAVKLKGSEMELLKIEKKNKKEKRKRGSKKGKKYTSKFNV